MKPNRLAALCCLYGVVSLLVYSPIADAPQMGWYYVAGTLCLCSLPGIEQRSITVAGKGCAMGFVQFVVFEVLRASVLLVNNYRTVVVYHPVMKYLPPHVRFDDHPMNLLPNDILVVISFVMWLLSLGVIWIALWDIRMPLRYLVFAAIPTILLSTLLVLAVPWKEFLKPFVFNEQTQMGEYPHYPNVPRAILVATFCVVPACVMWLRLLIEWTLPRQRPLGAP